MKKAESKKIYYYVDESGDPVFFNRKGKDLVKSKEASPVFMVGYMETDKPNLIAKSMSKLREEIKNDIYLRDIPSVKKSIIHFHAKDDCPEVREKVFKAIISMDIKTYIIVTRKNTSHFKIKFNGKPAKMYEYLVEKLFENRLHLYSDIDIYFSKMGNVIREKNMELALDNAKNNFSIKWKKKNESNLRIFIQKPSQVLPLQVIDYLLWAVYRVFVRGEMRYYNFVRDKISLIHDIFDVKKYPNNYYSAKNPLDIKKISPVNS